jgi:hypothetical protein
VERAVALVSDPPATMAELAARLGMRLEDLLTPGEVAMGSLPPTQMGIHASFRWDIHHEAPISSPEQLGPRELTAYSVRFDRGRAECEAVLSDGFRIEWPYGEAFTLTWTQPGPEVTPLETVLARIRTGEPVDDHVDAPARELAAALGVPDAIARTVDVHMSAWYLARADGQRIPGVEAALDGVHGELVPGLSLPAAAARLLHADDRVRHLRVTT